MKAIITKARGAAREVLEFVERDAPVATAGEVLVRIHASGVNPSDVKVRAGAQGPMAVAEVIPHNDGAGEIIAVGEGVNLARIGERVWLHNVNRGPAGVGQGANGTAAEIIAVPLEEIAHLPHGVSYEVGACLGVPAMTAHRAVFKDGSVKGKNVLVTGGAGSVGQLAVQMAVADGANVVTTVSSDAKAEIAKAAGAQTIINYKTEDLEARLIETFGQNGLDRIVDVDFAAHMHMLPKVLKQNGTVASYASGSNMTPEIPFIPLMFGNVNIELVFVYGIEMAARKQAIRDINDYLRAGILHPTIAQTFAFDDIASAHEAVESGKLTGNAVLLGA